jgi:hypothetical protein
MASPARNGCAAEDSEISHATAQTPREIAFGEVGGVRSSSDDTGQAFYGCLYYGLTARESAVPRGNVDQKGYRSG